ncbi:LLM class flavin-dependent oxidoreductase [Bhargavaea beijingensis]|uniref:LLM class flavin-dependent oxidoreductase n=1 Tax=Bhargavaea beijingensis TaxID=426756 RepID=A0ABX9ZA79_9BACL|nr:LLM class flavin-dependent oxidoreductase [Bhargavaea beijingensis]RSK25146.1 LLM class flavin-dependent oxidoreductase [Bhargavaea beijingensis]
MEISMLDQTQLAEGQTAEEGFAGTVEAARLADRLGYRRFWVSEHHGSDTIAGSSPEILAAHLLAKTETIRIGTGGVMLTHYAPYKVAENFRVMSVLSPGRVDLGVGKAPGGTHLPTIALQGGRALADAKPRQKERFPEMVDELMEYLEDELPENHPMSGYLQASPAAVQKPLPWILGTGPASALLAAERGLPYAFARFINAEQEEMRETIGLYRKKFRPSPFLERPYVALASRVFAAGTDDEAEWIARSAAHVQFGFHRGIQMRLPDPSEALAGSMTEKEKQEVRDILSTYLIGSKETLRRKMDPLSALGVDELMAITPVFSAESKRHSMAVLKEAANG